VYGLVELAGDGSAFVRRAAQRLGTQLTAAGDALTPVLQRRLRRGALEGLAVLVPLTGLAAFGASRDGNGWRALVHPVDAWRGTLLSKIDINGAPHRALRGAIVKFAVMADGRTEISLRRRTTGNAWVDVTLPVVHGVAQAELGPVDADLTIVASDGRATSDTLVVRIVDRPFLGDVAVRAIYPTYLHRAAEALPSDAPIRVPRGTALSLEGHSSESLAAVTLSQGTDSIRLLPSERRFSGHFTPMATGSWTWSGRGATASIADVPPPLVVEVVADSVPAAEILAPASDSLIAASDKVELQLVASDDHGLSAVSLKMWKTTRDGAAATPVLQKLAGGGIPDWSGRVTMELAAWGLANGDAVHVQLTARDETPWGQEGASRELRHAPKRWRRRSRSYYSGRTTPSRRVIRRPAINRRGRRRR
jgi:hypothetical protein